jgi:hypothetical protein
VLLLLRCLVTSTSIGSFTVTCSLDFEFATSTAGYVPSLSMRASGLLLATLLALVAAGRSSAGGACYGSMQCQ